MAKKSPEQIAEELIEEARRTGYDELDLDGVGLTSLPESIGRLVQLEILALSRNQLTTLPDSIGRLSQLQTFSASDNKLTALPDSIGRLSQLRELYLSENQLSALPDSIGQLSQLRQLYVSENQLTTLPETVGELSDLRRLHLVDNELTELPESITRLSRLEKLFLHGNDALGIPPEILGPTWIDEAFDEKKPAKPADIIEYYFRTRREARRRLNEAKILIVGQGAVGKTSLVKMLVHNQKCKEDEPQTEGINIEKWPLECKGPGDDQASSIRLNVWDFGGQEIMHATHQFFLTRRSLYILVLDARKGENESNIHYWLKIIQSYGGDSPVLIVTNKHEPPTHLDLNEKRLSLDYEPNVKGFFKVSCMTGSGIPALRAAIAEQIGTLPHVFNALPATYFAVKEKLEAMAQDEELVEIGRYKALCREHGVGKESEQNRLIRFLHDLGGVLNFDNPDDPYQLRDVNIFNPEWVTDGVYTIINSAEIVQAGGVLETNRLGRILDKKRYPPERHGFIVDMMRKFELCFDFPDAPGERLLIPELLNPNEPDLDWNTADALNFEYHYPVLPRGVVCRFIVRMQRNLTDKPTYWRSGVLLQIDKNRALVRSDSDKGRMYISAVGPRNGRRAALSVIRDTFSAIHATIPKLGAQEKVPLPDKPSVVVDYQHLLNLEERGIETYPPEGADREYSVEKLLNDIEEKSKRITERERRRGERMTGVKETPPHFVEGREHEVADAERPKIRLGRLAGVTLLFLFTFAVLIGGLALVSKYVDSAAAMTTITIAGILFAIIFFAFLALFTRAFGEATTERIIEKILGKVPVLKGWAGANPNRDDEK
ncbi:MAG: COR domain-containing protein [Phycisphaerae bacterium]